MMRRRQIIAAIALGLAFVITAPPAIASGPIFDPSGPDAALLGQGPEGFQRATAATFWQIPSLVDSLSRLDQIFPARRVGRPERPRLLARAVEAPAFTYRFAGETRTIDSYLGRNPITGLIVAKDDIILVERYQYDRRDTHRLTSWSMAKTVLSMLIGIARRRGRSARWTTRQRITSHASPSPNMAARRSVTC